MLNMINGFQILGTVQTAILVGIEIARETKKYNENKISGCFMHVHFNPYTYELIAVFALGLCPLIP